MADALTAPPRAAQVGKTSLILSLVGEEFPAEVRVERGRSPRCPSPGLGPPSRRVPCRSLPAPRRSPFPQTSLRRRCPPTSWITQVERAGPELRPCEGDGGRAAGVWAGPQSGSPLCAEAEQTAEELRDEIHKVRCVLRAKPPAAASRGLG